ncbi:single-minded homolog 1-like isoform X2 [Oscarella lobularis]|uniref:single-minded homolog 1-like isoform X2 n=1 Tax=Oscarella lobularis TaxID=121494 RepID=UPI0033132940
MSFGDAKAYQTAKRRRNATSDAVFQLADLLPLPPDTDVKKLKTNDVLRLTVGFMRLKHLLKGEKTTRKRALPTAYSSTSSPTSSTINSGSPLSTGCGQLSAKATIIRPDLLKALDGFVIVVDATDLNLVYISESAFDYLGIYMIDLIGRPLRNLVVSEDLDSVASNLSCTDFGCRTFFCRMKSAKGKRPNGRTRSPGQKLVHVTGRMHRFQCDQSSQLCFVGTVRVVKPTPIAKPRFSVCLFTSRTTLELQIIKIDSTVAPELSGSRGKAISGFKCQQYWHPDDLSWIMDSFDKLLKFGEGIWLVHRIMYKGHWAWIQAHSTICKNKYIDNSVSLVSEEVGLRALNLREPLSTSLPSSPPSLVTNDKIPVTRLRNRRQRSPVLSELPSPQRDGSSEATAILTTDWSDSSSPHIFPKPAELPPPPPPPPVAIATVPFSLAATSVPSVESAENDGGSLEATGEPMLPSWSNSTEFDSIINDLLSNSGSNDCLFDMPILLDSSSREQSCESYGHLPSIGSSSPDIVRMVDDDDDDNLLQLHLDS